MNPIPKTNTSTIILLFELPKHTQPVTQPTHALKRISFIGRKCDHYCDRVGTFARGVIS